MNRARLPMVFAILYVGGCHTSASQPAPQTAARQSRSVVRDAPPTPAPIPREHAFLVHTDAHQLELRSSVSPATRILAPHVDSALYHDSLELVWFLDGDRLNVLDLRKPGAEPVLVARGSREHRLMIQHGEQSISTEDGCDLPFIELDWTATPKIDAVLHDAPGLHLENSAWLRAELQRPARSIGTQREFSDARVALPAKALDCEEDDVCGASVPFGAGPRELVLVVEKMGGDCFQRACLLHDPRTKRFATPPSAKTWAGATDTARGPCGPYLFDQVQTSFLMGRSLCGPDGLCQDLGGFALGWLVPGDSVGEPGLGNFDKSQ